MFIMIGDSISVIFKLMPPLMNKLVLFYDSDTLIPGIFRFAHTNLRVEKKVLVERVTGVFGWDLGGHRGRK